MPPPPGTTRREIELDFIRGIAILMVLIFHYRPHDLLIASPVLNHIEGFGWTGVDVFFVLSGFLVGGLLMKEWQRTGSVDSARFLKRRAFKIWPGYYFFLLVAAIIHVRPLKSFFWQNLFNIQNYIPSSLAHTWSLAVEEQFYLSLAALLALWTARHWRPATLLSTCIALSLAVEALRAALASTGHQVYFYTHTRLDGLLLGVALAAVHTFWPEWFQRLQQQRLLLLAIVLIGLWRLYVDVDAYPEPDALSSPFLITFVDYAAAALLLLLYRRRPTHNRAYRVVAQIGIYSYGIYLWHVSVERPVNWAVAHVPHSLAAATSTLLPYVLAIPLGILATKAIEFPFLRLRQRLVPSRTPEPQIPEPQSSATEVPVG
ncbi:MAG: acyltransferase [Acidobacteriaceae bacterium]